MGYIMSQIIRFTIDRHSELIDKYKVGLVTLLQQGIPESVLYGDLVYRFKRICEKPSFLDFQTL